MARAGKQIERMAAKEFSAKLRATNITRQFGFELLEADANRVVLQMRVTPRHLQVHGVVHGGVMAALADTAGGLSVYLQLPPGSRVATVEMKINYLEAVERGVVMAEARVIRLGKHFGVVDCDVREHDGRLCAKALMTFAVIHRGPKAKGRRG
jgi:uncharacterized protein (TIGR00369 family)